uniref:Uncharacterized protein n=1 Tax=Oryza meridionalis TaxID=40149 RepID=A0A0E0EPN5_9ORYZ
MAGVGGRLGTVTASVVRQTMTRLKDGGAPWDYEEAYPVLYLGGGGPRWRGDELPRRSAAAMVAADLRRRGPKLT